jgi:CrcB protein
VTLAGALAVALGAAVGAPCRYLLDRAVQRRHRTGLPLGLLVVNVLGSAVLGLLAGLADLDATLMLGLATGWCGAFTTFSSFGLEAVVLARSGRWWWALAHAVASIGLGLLAATGGDALGQRLGGAP